MSGPAGHGAEPTPAPPGGLARLWAWCLGRPRLTLLLVVALQTLPGMGLRDLWMGDEVRHGSVLQHAVEDGDLLVLHLNGEPYPDKPPLWFWLLGAIAKPLGSTEPWVFYAGAALATVLLAWATLRLARDVGRLSASGALAAALLLTVLPLTLLLDRTTRMDLLFAAAITAAGSALFRGLTQAGPGRATLAAFGWAAVATWIKGPFGLGFPLVAALGFLAWRGRLRRLWARDVGLGLLLYAGLLAVWAAGVVLAEGWDFLGSVLAGQVVGRFVAAEQHAEPPWYYAAFLVPCVLPLSLLPLLLPARPGAWGQRLRTAWAARRQGDDGRTWLVAWGVGGAVLLSVSSTKLFIYLAPLLPVVCVLSAAALLRADEAATRRSRVGAAALLALLGLALPFAIVTPLGRALGLPELLPVAAALLLAAGVTWAVRRSAFGPATLGAVLGLVPALGLASVLVLPALNPLLSPRSSAERLRQEEARGYVPAAYGLYGGQLAYHLGHPLFETRRLEALAEFLAREPRALVVLPEHRWPLVHERLPRLVPAYRQALLGDTLLLVRHDLLANAPGAPGR